jgi:hypothetical protein
MSRKRKATAAFILLELLPALAARARGYDLGRHTLVRCAKGHVFTTIWIPGVSVKALRLGWWRIQYCPVGRHWSIVRPVRGSDLSRAQRLLARSRRDVRLP